VPVDKNIVNHLVTASPEFHVDDSVHRREHCLEVMLPFLQQMFDSFKMVPILLSQTTDELIQTVAQALVDIVDSRTVLVVSSDLSHYPSQANAEKVDGQTIEAILTGDIRRRKRQSTFIPKGHAQPSKRRPAAQKRSKWA
jgi:AmmeMemoRadiSam system protein B